MFGDYLSTKSDFVDWLQTIERKRDAQDCSESQSEACRIKGKPRPERVHKASGRENPNRGF